MIASPLRYPGGKARLYKFFVELIKCNDLLGCEYCEPYAGGAGLAIRLLTDGFVSRINLNDIDLSIYAFWHSVFYSPDKFSNLIETTAISLDEWHKQQQIWKLADKTNLVELGFAAYFLNRTNRSGIIDGAGPIGGYHQTGVWKLDARINKVKQIKNIRELSRFSNQVTLKNIDAQDYIKLVGNEENSLIYLDPPYYVKGHKLYRNSYQPSDHADIAASIQALDVSNWVVSYDDVAPITSLYNGRKTIKYNMDYSAGRITSGREVMFLSDSLCFPAAGLPQSCSDAA